MTAGDDEDLMSREPDVAALQRAYGLLSADPERAARELEGLANAGSIKSMMYLGNLYQQGPHADFSKAERWYRSAYKLGALNAIYALGSLYYRQRKYEEAEEIFADGVSRNDGPSLYWLASIYTVDPRHVGKSEEIRNLLERATALGQVHAKHNLGLLLMKGRYGIRHIPRGVFLFMCGAVDAFRVTLRDPDSRRLW